MTLVFWTLLFGLLLVVTGVLLVRRLRARKAAESLEQAIARHGEAQVNQVPPARRAEILELQRQVTDGIAALKRSKLKRGVSGATALYALPWYLIIGPPGAGKTTALKHSGLEFPYGAGASGSVRGIGGTRNCDWWFTNEAILLDTAGRYATDKDDREEWLGFLRLLVKHRSRRPLDGIILAVSTTDLLDATETDLEIMGKKLRARMDEATGVLGMELPVYLLLTKVDLVAGFVEFFADMKRSDRAEPWGATLPLGAPIGDTSGRVATELDVLIKALHARSLRRLVLERSRDAKEKIHQFPIELAALKPAIARLVGVAFAPNAFQATPLLRGFYFTSGTQEGRPTDRVLERMSAAMGIGRAAGAAVPLESKSYFLRNVFLDIIFKDKGVAALSTTERRRRALMNAAIGAAALALATAIGVPAYRSYNQNAAFLQESRARAAQAAAVAWADGGAVSAKVRSLDPLLEQLRTLDTFEAEGAPLSMGWGMYVADRARTPLLRVYVAQSEGAFVAPVRRSLERELQTADGSRYLEHWRLLKLYLMLVDPGHVDVEWATGRFASRWTQELGAAADLSPIEMARLSRPHAQYYFELLRAKRIVPPPIDTDLVARVRSALQQVPVAQRYDDIFVNGLKDMLIDEAGDETVDNLTFPPITLASIFRDRPEALKHVKSRRFEETRRFQQVEGPYTERGHAAVLELLKAASGLLETEAWVVPLTEEEAPRKIPEHLAGVAKRYETEYVRQWTALFADVRVERPTTTDQAIELYRVLSTTPYPFGRLVEVLENETQWRRANPLDESDALAREANRRFNARLQMYSRGITFDVDLRALGRKMDVVPQTFRSATEVNKGSRQRGGDSRMFEYARVLRDLRMTMIERKRDSPTLSLAALNEALAQSRVEAEQLLSGHDEKARALLLPLLLAPVAPRGPAGSVEPGNPAPGGSGSAAWPMPAPPRR